MMTTEESALTRSHAATTESASDHSTLPPSEKPRTAGQRGAARKGMAGSGDGVKGVTCDMSSGGSERSQDFSTSTQRRPELQAPCQESSLTVSSGPVGQGEVVEGDMVKGEGGGGGGEGARSKVRSKGAEGVSSGVKKRRTILALHVDIIGDTFWEAHPHLLGGRDC